MRIACLHVVDFPLAAVLRLEPDLRGRPVAVADGAGERAAVAAVSAEARRAGVRPGTTVARARALCAPLVVRRAGAEALASADAALLDVADSFSPRVEAAGGGVVFLDVEGLAGLFGSEAHLASSLAARTRRIGLEARVGVASSKTTAAIVARSTDGVAVSPADRERQVLAPLPLALLDPPPALAESCARLGLRTLGDLGRLPAAAVATRLGREALAAWRRARGEDETPLSPGARAPVFAESVDCEYAVASFEPLSFLLRGALERLVARLEVRGLRAGDLRLSLRLDGGGREERTVAVAAPARDPKALLALVRLSFERRPPGGAVEWFRLTAAAERPRPAELGLFAPAGPAAEDLDLAVVRLAALAGPARVGRPAPLDSHRPEAFAVERFGPPPGAPAAPAPRSGGEEAAVLALRAFRPPARLEVACDRGRPDFVRSDTPGAARLGGRVVTLAGPWRVAAEWWREPPLARDYWDAELTDGCVYRIYVEHRSGEWFADGVYD